MSIQKLLLKLARKVLQQVTSVIASQIKIMRGDVADVALKLVGSGFDDVWRGTDAQTFKEDVGKAVQNLINAAIVPTEKTHKGLDQACNIIVSADQKVAGLVSDLNNTFSKIF